MSNSSNKIRSCVLLLLISFLSVGSTVLADRLYAPPYLWDRHIAEKTDPIEIANTHVGIPYRDDGAIDDRGYFTTFSDPSRFFDTPGLNCSGLVLSVSRFLFNKNWSLQDATRDRLGDSGPSSSSGKDWDFGWDLIFNITEGFPRRIILPGGEGLKPESSDANSLRGFDLQDTRSWQNALDEMKPGCAYLGSISRMAPESGNRLLHYHVVLIIPAKDGSVHLYHATRRSNVHRINIGTQQGLQRFLGQFRSARQDPKRMLLVEAALPDLVTAAESPATDSSAAKPSDKPLVPPAPSVPGPAAQDGPVPEQEQGPSRQIGSPPTADSEKTSSSSPPRDSRPVGPDLVVNHLAGKVFRSLPDLVTHVPGFGDDAKTSLQFWFQNRGNQSRPLEIFLKTPSGDFQVTRAIPPLDRDFRVLYPKDFPGAPQGPIAHGEYLADMRIDGVQWSGDLFEVSVPREAQPKITSVKFPAQVQAGKTFTVLVEAKNAGAESDYGGITISSPDPAGLKILSAKPGKIYGSGSTVLSVTSDRIRTKVPMAERWIELWGEGKTYDIQVQVQAGRPGTYPLFVRCALRGVNVKSSVILMDPASADTVDQQGFPVFVYQVTVR
ncbi:MAG: hypothetical protein QG577_1640 [Thermodesulfobacteriota bacterium]|nr:hypothetical protein [Thermodesulfobacteriota bacterium]